MRALARIRSPKASAGKRLAWSRPTRQWEMSWNLLQSRGVASQQTIVGKAPCKTVGVRTRKINPPKARQQIKPEQEKMELRLRLRCMQQVHNSSFANKYMHACVWYVVYACAVYVCRVYGDGPAPLAMQGRANSPRSGTRGPAAVIGRVLSDGELARSLGGIVDSGSRHSRSLGWEELGRSLPDWFLSTGAERGSGWRREGFKGEDWGKGKGEVEDGTATGQSNSAGPASTFP
jgi:hypothetical protein